MRENPVPTVAGGGAPRVGAWRRVLATLPSALADLMTATLCVAAWAMPQALPEGLLRSTALIMLIEFLSIHGMVIVPILALLLSARWPWLGLGLALLVYIGIAVGASLALQTWWPTLAFAWLLLSRYVLPRWNLGRADEHLDAGRLWVVSTVLWLGLAFATVLLPVPAWGWDAATIARLGLPGEGLWVDEPQRLLAFAASYFLLLAWFKFGSTPEPAARPKPRDVRRAGRG
jgi:hypothetical protein